MTIEEQQKIVDDLDKKCRFNPNYGNAFVREKLKLIKMREKAKSKLL